LFIASLAGCKKKEKTTPTEEPYKCPTCVTTPEAKAAYNNSSAGVYKGVLVGSTGTIGLYIYNTGTDVKALVSFDGKNTTLTTTSLSGWTPGQPINNAVFTGTLNGQNISVTFSVGANGQNPSIQVSIPGHTVTVGVYKETSETLIKNFEGTYAGDDAGVFNMVLNGQDYSIVTDDGGIYTGKLVNGEINYTNASLEIKGTFSGDKTNGTWKGTNGKQGTWNGTRTM
jgi:hypothetical protein